MSVNQKNFIQTTESFLKRNLALDCSIGLSQSPEVEKILDYKVMRDLGRTALKQAILNLGLNEDAESMTFPHPRFSITHSFHTAVAIGLKEPRYLGIGIDLEKREKVKVESARFFLSSEELDKVKTQENSKEFGGTLLRIWTIKEAVFKSDPDNKDRGLKDYTLCDPLAAAGEAFYTKNKENKNFRYASIHQEELGTLSVSICERHNNGK